MPPAAGPEDPVPQRAGLPRGYPAALVRQVVLRDGRRVLLRPVLPGDAAELGEAIRTADADTLRRRFLGGAPRITSALLAYLTTVDYVRRLALVAIDPVTQRGVAIGRYDQVDEGVAEVAVAVSPAWRRAGLAAALISLLAEAAASRGIRTFTASYIAENQPVAALVEDAGGLSGQVIEQGIAEFSVALDHRRDGVADEAADRAGPLPATRAAGDI